MPCSRSAFRPSVRSEKSIGPALRFFDASDRRELVFVDRPSNRRAAGRSACSCHHPRCRRCRSAQLCRTPVIAPRDHLEVALALLQLHRAFLVVIDDAVLALGLPRGISSSMIFGTVSAVERIAPVQEVQPSERMRHITICGFSPAAAADRARAESASRRAPPSRSLAKYSGTIGIFFDVDVLPDVELGPVRQQETRGWSRPCRCARCRDSRAPAAGSSDPTGRSRRGTRRCAPWRGSSPRRAGRRRTRRRIRPASARRAAPWS